MNGLIVTHSHGLLVAYTVNLATGDLEQQAAIRTGEDMTAEEMALEAMHLAGRYHLWNGDTPAGVDPVARKNVRVLKARATDAEAERLERKRQKDRDYHARKKAAAGLPPPRRQQHGNVSHTREQIAARRAVVLEYIRTHPGLGVSELAQALGPTLYPDSPNPHARISAVRTDLKGLTGQVEKRHLSEEEWKPSTGTGPFKGRPISTAYYPVDTEPEPEPAPRIPLNITPPDPIPAPEPYTPTD